MNISHFYFDIRTCIIIKMYNKCVQLWALDSKLLLTNIFSVELPSTVPCTLYFEGADILVLGMYDREM